MVMCILLNGVCVVLISWNIELICFSSGIENRKDLFIFSKLKKLNGKPVKLTLKDFLISLTFLLLVQIQSIS